MTKRIDLDWSTTKAAAIKDKNYFKRQGFERVSIRKSPSGEGYLVSGIKPKKSRRK